MLLHITLDPTLNLHAAGITLQYDNTNGSSPSAWSSFASCVRFLLWVQRLHTEIHLLIDKDSSADMSRAVATQLRCWMIRSGDKASTPQSWRKRMWSLWNARTLVVLTFVWLHLYSSSQPDSFLWPNLSSIMSVSLLACYPYVVIALSINYSYYRSIKSHFISCLGC